jgi:hypothetical protein
MMDGCSSVAIESLVDKNNPREKLFLSTGGRPEAMPPHCGKV